MDQKENPKQANHKTGQRFLFFLISCSFILWGLTPFVLNLFSQNLTEKGQIGDMFGSVNSLFSGLALIGVVYTIYLQGEQTEDQRKQAELDQQHNEKAREQVQKQTEAMKEQQLLSVFSQMYSDLSRALEQIAFQKITQQNSVTGGIANKTEPSYGVAAITNYISVFGAQQIRANPLVTTTFTMDAVSQYLSLYLLIFEWIDHIGDETVRIMCRKMVVQVHQNGIQKVLAQRAIAFSPLDARMLDEVAKIK